MWGKKKVGDWFNLKIKTSHECNATSQLVSSTDNMRLLIAWLKRTKHLL